MNSDDPELHSAFMRLWPVVWPFLGGLGGSIISLGLAKNATLSARKKAFNVLSGTLAAVFLGPLAVRWSLGIDTRADSELVGAVYCLVGLAATSLADRVVIGLAALLDKVLPRAQKDAE